MSTRSAVPPGRNHQGIGKELIDGGELPGSGLVECQERHGGLLE